MTQWGDGLKDQPDENEREVERLEGEVARLGAELEQLKVSNQRLISAREVWRSEEEDIGQVCDQYHVDKFCPATGSEWSTGLRVKLLGDALAAKDAKLARLRGALQPFLQLLPAWTRERNFVVEDPRDGHAVASIPWDWVREWDAALAASSTPNALPQPDR